MSLNFLVYCYCCGLVFFPLPSVDEWRDVNLENMVDLEGERGWDKFLAGPPGSPHPFHRLFLSFPRTVSEARLGRPFVLQSSYSLKNV